MRRIAPMICAIPLVLSFGIVEGAWTGRWHSALALSVAGQSLLQLPNSFGPWVGQDDSLDERQIVKAELTGSLLRHYTHRGNGSTLTVLLVCGRPGPVSVHTPDVCFVGSGAILLDRPEVQSLNTPVHTSYLSARFRKGDELGAEFSRVAWTWSTDGTWNAPANPRITFARAPVLFKLYVIQRLERPEEPATEPAMRDFLNVLLPQIRDSVISDLPNRTKAAEKRSPS